jgi:hypothetical protein
MASVDSRGVDGPGKSRQHSCFLELNRLFYQCKHGNMPLDLGLYCAGAFARSTSKSSGEDC